MKKIYLYLVSQMLLAGSLLFSSQGLSEEMLKFDVNSNQIEGTLSKVLLANNPTYQTLYIDDSSRIPITSTGHFNNDRESPDSETVLNLCEESILGIVDGKAYLNPNKLLVCQGHYLLLNDHQQWLSLNEVFKDGFGFYIRAKELRCEKGHVGFKRVFTTWYCLEEDCPYYYFKHFN